MFKNRMILIMLIIMMLSASILISQESNKDDKYTTVNIILSRVFFTGKGLIVEYYLGNKFKEAYFPNRFFEEDIVVKVVENITSMTPQMNVVFKNGEPFKVKLYMPDSPEGLTYPIVDFLTPEMSQKFDSLEKLEIDLYEGKEGQQ